LVGESGKIDKKAMAKMIADKLKAKGKISETRIIFQYPHLGKNSYVYTITHVQIRFLKNSYFNTQIKPLPFPSVPILGYSGHPFQRGG